LADDSWQLATLIFSEVGRVAVLVRCWTPSPPWTFPEVIVAVLAGVWTDRRRR
jgi:hypothetical protein